MTPFCCSHQKSAYQDVCSVFQVQWFYHDVALAASEYGHHWTGRHILYIIIISIIIIQFIINTNLSFDVHFNQNFFHMTLVKLPLKPSLLYYNTVNTSV